MKYAAALLLLALVGTALPLLVAACGSASANAGTYSSFDGGSGSDAQTPYDASGSDAAFGDSGSGQDGATSLPTTALLVQASPSLDDMRLCWAHSGVVAPVPPFPSDGAMPGSNYPGVPVGGVVAMSDATPLLGAGLTLYAIDADNLASIEFGQPTPLPTCDMLLACPGEPDPPPPCLRENLDYWPVPTMVGSLVAHLDNVVALSGCLSSSIDLSASTARCGATFDPLAGNLHADVLQLLPASPAASMGPLGSVQAAQLSPALAEFAGDGGVTFVSFGAEGADAAVPVAGLQGEGEISPATSLHYEAGLPGYGQLGFAVDVPGDDSGAGHVWMSLADSQQLVDPTEDPTQFFGQPRTYLVAVLGDPHAPHAFGPVTGDAGYDGRGLHILVVAAPLPEGGVPSDASAPSEAGEAGDAGEAGETGDAGVGGD